MNTRSKQSGFSTVELGISCTVFAAMAIITTGSMVESIRSTTNAEVSAGTVDEARKGFDRLAKDIQGADAVLARYRAAASSPEESEDDEILLRIPRFDSTGARVAGEYLVVHYQLSGGAQPHLIRRVSRWDGATAGPWGPPQRLIPGILGLGFDYQFATTVRTGALGSVLALPGRLVGGSPDGGEVQLVAVRTRDGSIDTEDPGGVLPATLRTGLNVPVPAGLENQSLDVRFRIDPEFVSQAPHANRANMVLVKLAAKNTVRGQGTITRLVSRFNLRNKQ